MRQHTDSISFVVYMLLKRRTSQLFHAPGQYTFAPPRCLQTKELSARIRAQFRGKFTLNYMDYFKRVFKSSGPHAIEEGIITVNSSTATTATQQSLPVADTHDPLLQHLRELQSRAPTLDARSFSSKAPDSEGLLADVQLAKQIGHDTGSLDQAVLTLISSYESWHSNHIQALTANQDYIARTMDQAEFKAAKAVRHIQTQTVRMKALSASLEDAAGLPAMLTNITATTAALEQQLQQLEQLAAEQQQEEASKGKG